MPSTFSLNKNTIFYCLQFFFTATIADFRLSFSVCNFSEDSSKATKSNNTELFVISVPFSQTLVEFFE